MGKPSRSCHGEGHVHGARTGTRRGPSGVWGAARVEGEARNTRDPSASPPSRQVASYKPKAKSTDAQRESEGSVVPSRVATNNATGGKGPWGGHAGRAGKREGMAGTSGPNNPDRRKPADKVRQLQRLLMGRGQTVAGKAFPRAVRPHLEERRPLGGVETSEAEQGRGGRGLTDVRRRRAV